MQSAHISVVTNGVIKKLTYVCLLYSGSKDWLHCELFVSIWFCSVTHSVLSDRLHIRAVCVVDQPYYFFYIRLLLIPCLLVFSCINC